MKINLDQPVRELLNRAILSGGAQLIEINANEIRNTPPALVVVVTGDHVTAVRKMLVDRLGLALQVNVTGQ